MNDRRVHGRIDDGPEFVCGECGASVADPDGTLREGDLTLCEETRCDAEVREEASP